MKVGWHHQPSANRVDLGEEPPLVVGPSGPEAFGRRSVSIRWLTGTVLTGITSTVLMGGALIGSLDGRYSITLPAAAHVGTVADQTADNSPAAKGDLIKPAAAEISNKQIVEVSTVTRLGERNLIKMQPYALVTASLITRVSEIAEDIPPFNPLSIFKNTTVFPSRAATDEIYDAQVDGEITVTEHEFPSGAELAFAPGADMSTEEAEVQLREQQWFDGSASIEFANTALASDHRFDFAFVDPQSLGDAEISIVPENVSELVKSADDDGDGASADEAVALVAKGDTLGGILSKYGATEDNIKEIQSVLLARWDLEDVSAGQTVRMEIERYGFDDNAGTRPVRVSIYDDAKHLATVAMTDEQEFVAAEPPEDAAPVIETAVINPQPRQGTTPSVYNALYQTAREHDVPEDLIDDMVRTFSFDVDFNGRVRAGDQFSVFYALPENRTDTGAPPEVLFTSLTAGGVERRFYRFRTPDDGSVDFYDETGKSAQKFLMRKPMARGVFRSGFGYRRHPILGYSKLHTGVDWAAPRGTPIFASGNGTITEIGWKSGYGRWTLVKHANGYETGYAHQSGWAKGLTKGSRVRQGQVIGYVGSTGLSTGPHLHYEVHVNGRPVDPLRIRLPRGRELTGEMLTAFERERERIDALVHRETPSEARIARN